MLPLLADPLGVASDQQGRRARAPEITGKAPSHGLGRGGGRPAGCLGSQGLDESGPCLFSCRSPGHLFVHTVPALDGGLRWAEPGGRDPLTPAQRQTQTPISAVLGAGLQSQQVLGFNPGFGIYQEALLGGLLSPQPHLCGTETLSTGFFLRLNEAMHFKALGTLSVRSKLSLRAAALT